ncbi:hypothetical protein [Acinetobacter haemolyticus]|uniref:hypothetical protein n=1 Tax=Acinetobacter haemolyticus TaxID=29430 RepID=UPI000F73825F|nr:hypothetical protein [Acinetobacter haemolyticus]RSN77917.1 hypothetical protein EA769_03600 [Acinetobacter haemolyticus]
MLIIAYFIVFFIGVVACFKEAKNAWVARKINGLTVFEKRSYTAIASVSVLTACAGIGGLIQAAIKVI